MKKLFALLLTVGLIGTLAPVAAAPSGHYRNPVSRGFGDTFADPAVVKGLDGYWYAFGTSDPLREGEGDFHYMPIARSNDLVHWEHVGDVFDDGNRPSWADSDSFFWAPDVRYFDGKWHLYFVATQTTVTPERNDNAIGVATAPSPAGPWTDSGDPVVGPRRGSGATHDFKWTFDPSEFTDKDGKRYLYFGSYYGGIFVTRLTNDGTETFGKRTMVGIDNRYEGAYVIRHGRYYYLFASSANCCAGPTTGYSVYVGRATSPRGVFKDRLGQSMIASRVGGTPVIAPNGNKWVGTGHNAVVTDLAGRDWFVYHAINRNDPYLDGTSGINERPMLIDRLDWVDGWPTVRAGHWASAGRQRAPITRWDVGSEFNREGSISGWHRTDDTWTHEGRLGNAFLRNRPEGRSCEPSFFLSNRDAPRRVRVEGDLKQLGAAGKKAAMGIVGAYRNRRNYVAAWVDLVTERLVLEARVNGVRRAVAADSIGQPFTKSWHNVAMEIRRGRVVAEITDRRLHDPIAKVGMAIPAASSRRGKVGAAARCAGFKADNVGGAELANRHNFTLNRPPDSGARLPAFSDNFEDGVLDPAWTWVREPAGREVNGRYRWRVQMKELAPSDQPPTNTASVLLRPAPPGEYTVTTKLRINLGVNDVRNYQQGGLIVYQGDDDYIKLAHVAIWNTRQTEFAKEMPYAGGVSYGGTLVGPPQRTTLLRIAHHIDERHNEHEFRAATRRPGEPWVWGGTWTMPLESTPRIGLISLGARNDTDPRATSKFEYFRVTAP